MRELRSSLGRAGRGVHRSERDLERAKAIGRRSPAARSFELEETLADRDRRLQDSNRELDRLTLELKKSYEEVESIRRRTDDYVHLANLERDNAVRTFQADLWHRLRPSLAEILDESSDATEGLNADQLFFRRRLSEIREALREQGVPPY